MLKLNNKHSHIKSVQLIQKYVSYTTRTGKEQQSFYKNLRVAPWSGDEYYDKIKQDIKNQEMRKRSQTSTMYQRYKEMYPKDVSTRVKTVNIQITPSVEQQIKNQWSKILPKKKSSKVFVKEVPKMEKALSHQKLSTQLQKSIFESSPNPIIHKRKMSIKRFPHSKHTTHRPQTELSEDNMNKIKDLQNIFSKNEHKKHNIFFFETKNKNVVSQRERMVMKIRNLQKGRVERAITNNY